MKSLDLAVRFLLELCALAAFAVAGAAAGGVVALDGHIAVAAALAAAIAINSVLLVVLD